MRALLPCVPRDDAERGTVDEGRRDDVVVRNSTYRFNEDEEQGEELAAETRRPTPQHRLNTDPEAFQTPGSSVRLIGKSRVEKRRRRFYCRRSSGKDSSLSQPCRGVNCLSPPRRVDATTSATRRLIPFHFTRRQRRRREPEGEGQSNPVEGQGHGGDDDLEMTLNDDQQRWLDVDLLRNDVANSTTVGR